MNGLPVKARDWFALQREKNDASPTLFSYEEFITEMKFQINRKIKREASEKFCFDGGYTLEETKFLVEEHQFPLVSPLSSLENSQAEKYLPLLTFHATNNVNAVRSISKHGYFVPNDIHPTDGFTFKTKNGACFGEGVYSSTIFDTAKWFSFIDKNGYVMLFVNLVFLGQVHQVANDPQQNIIKEISGYNSTSSEMWTKRTVVTNPLWDDGILQTIDGKFGNGSDTRMRAEGHIVVSGSGKNIVPIALLTLRPNWELQKMKIYLPVTTPTDHLYSLDHKTIHHRINDLIMYRVCDDWHVLQAEKLEDKKVISRHYVIADIALAQRPIALRQLKNFFGALDAKEKFFYLFDGSNTKKTVPGMKASFSVCSSNTADGFLGANVRGAKKIVTDEQWMKNFEFTLCSIFELITNCNLQCNEIVFNIYVFLNRVISVSMLENFINKYAPLVETARLVGVKLIFTDEFGAIDYDWINFFKNRLQTVNRFESLAHHIKDQAAWSTIIDNILEENKNKDHLLHVPYSTYKVPCLLGVVGEGFVVDLEHNPLWSVSSPSAILYKGYAPLSTLNIDGVQKKIKYMTRDHVISLIEDNDESWIRAKKRDAAEVAERRSKRREAVKHYALMLSAFSTAAIQILCRFRAFVIRSAERFKLYAPAVQQLCESVMKEVAYIEDSEELRSFCDSARLSTCCHQMQCLLSDVKIFSGLSFKGALFDQLMNMKFAKSIVKRADSTLVAPEDSLENIVKKDAMFASSDLMQGKILRVFVPSSAQVEPWNIIVNDFDEDVNISAREAILSGKQILLNTNFRGTTEEKWLYAHFFTKNPHLFLPGQPRALLTVTWVRSLELFFRRNDARLSKEKKKDAQIQFRFCYDLALRVAESFSKQAQMSDLVMRIGTETDAKNIAALLTEGNNVTSPCKLLGALLRPTAAPIFAPNNVLFPAFSFALLAETIMRNCRAYLKTFTVSNVNQIVCDTLGINETNYKTFELDLAKAALNTGNFYVQQFTNCSAFAIVAALGFIQMFHEKKNANEIFNAFESNSISMRNFLWSNSVSSISCSSSETNFRENLARKTQLALFLQGIRFHKSNMRQKIVFDPDQIICDSIHEQKVAIANQVWALSNNASRETIRMKQRLAEAFPFVSYHKQVKLFTPTEVDEFNFRLGMERRDEWAIWDERSGLLRHHCCYPDCPDYLKNFATEKDLKNKTRNGIMNHLQYDTLNRNYVPRFNMMAKSYANRESFPVFINAMDNKFKDCLYYKAVPREFMLQALSIAYERFKK